MAIYDVIGRILTAGISVNTELDMVVDECVFFQDHK